MLEGRPENKHYICIKDVTTWTPKVLTSKVLVYKCGLRNQYFRLLLEIMDVLSSGINLHMVTK